MRTVIRKGPTLLELLNGFPLEMRLLGVGLLIVAILAIAGLVVGIGRAANRGRSGESFDVTPMRQSRGRAKKERKPKRAVKASSRPVGRHAGNAEGLVSVAPAASLAPLVEPVLDRPLTLPSLPPVTASSAPAEAPSLFSAPLVAVPASAAEVAPSPAPEVAAAPFSPSLPEVPPVVAAPPRDLSGGPFGSGARDEEW